MKRVMNQNAKQLWSEIAPEHSYYGFLSADRLNLDYSIDGLVAQVALSEAAGIAIAVDGVQRIREWLALNKPYNARRELMQLKKTQSKEFWLHAAILFDAWKWHDGAIQAIYGSGQYARFELDVSHPSPFIETVRRESVRYGVPEHWIYAIMRQESHFVHDISSKCRSSRADAITADDGPSDCKSPKTKKTIERRFIHSIGEYQTRSRIFQAVAGLNERKSSLCTCRLQCRTEKFKTMAEFIARIRPCNLD